MTIGPREVRHVARLAELAVADDDVDRLATEMERIVEMVGELDPVPETAPEHRAVGPVALRLRADRIDPIPMELAPGDLAPDFRDGFFVVPRTEGLADE